MIADLTGLPRFQPAPPIGAETHTSFQMNGSTYPFQPPPPMRRRRIMLNQAASDREFQPSPPTRRRHVVLSMVLGAGLFQPTPPVGAETPLTRRPCSWSSHFNPLRPHGRRPCGEYFVVAQFRISTHSACGAETSQRECWTIFPSFQPAPSVRTETTVSLICSRQKV